jgi:hypothetical protein
VSATYNPALSSDTDWVRLLIGDTDTTNAQLSNEEIGALLLEEPTFGSNAAKYYASAAAIDVIVTRVSGGSGTGIGEFSLGGIRIKPGMDSTAITMLKDRASWLRKRGAQASGRQKVLRAFGGYGRHGERIVPGSTT